MTSRARVGIDIGGTFTDVVCWRDGRLTYAKLPSTPRDYGEALLAGVRWVDGEEAELSHGSTVATNALLERKVARCALITTEGFRDVLVIGRQARPSLYDLHQTRPDPLVPDDLRREVAERVAPDGEVIRPLDEGEAERVVGELAERVEAVAICLLFGFAFPEHERRLAEIARRRGLFVSVAHEILPEFREYERTATTVVNAAVGPIMARYLANLSARLGGRPLRVMQSNGGCIDAETAGREAVRTVLSGPAAGVVGAWTVAREAGLERLITFDMGGTSTDVAVCDGRLPLTRETVLGGLPIGVPTLDIHTVGAGGGSLARRDAGGALAVGPESAGAEPGPACYHRGGAEPTVTDANLVLGRLPLDRFLGGRMTLRPGRAEAAVDRLARDLGMDRLTCALGIVQVAEAAMERAIRVISVERGHDPREYALVSFGGAGGLHAASLASRLGIGAVLVPAHAGALSALGLLLADLVRDAALTVMRPLAELTADGLREEVERLAAAERARLLAQGGATPGVEPLLDLRYHGQSFELSRPCPSYDPDEIAEDFHTAHEQRYGYRRDDAPIELVTLRVRVTSPAPELSREPRPAGAAVSLARQPCCFTSWLETEVYDLEAFGEGAGCDGPALLAGEDTTVLVPPGWRADGDAFGNVRLTVSARSAGA